MKCPVCNVDLAMGERLTVQIDYCPKCRGIWLEKGKLDTLLEKSGAAAQSTKQDKDQRRKNDDDDDEGGVGGFLRGIFD